MAEARIMHVMAHLKIFQAGICVENKWDFLVATEMIAIIISLHDVEMLNL